VPLTRSSSRAHAPRRPLGNLQRVTAGVPRDQRRHRIASSVRAARATPTRVPAAVPHPRHRPAATWRNSSAARRPPRRGRPELTGPAPPLGRLGLDRRRERRTTGRGTAPTAASAPTPPATARCRRARRHGVEPVGRGGQRVRSVRPADRAAPAPRPTNGRASRARRCHLGRARRAPRPRPSRPVPLGHRPGRSRDASPDADVNGLPSKRRHG